MKTIHDYLNQQWGHAISIIRPQDDGTVFMMGHGLGIERGHYLSVHMESGKTGYMLVKTISYLRDPRDMWQGTFQFTGYDDPNKETSWPSEKANTITS